ncbi:hypothetical protein VIPECOOM01_00242 [Escherichia phage vB_VIPECOOM01]|uniref:DUF7247 domain-containing protein n=3 Tax=Tequatrovirus vipecoom TaxID=3350239 RepID=A0AAF0FN99_9CAUD|nr:hypothetical protein VIPECOOM01_00242 [Escherichia phage vB_VIPECOOM01]WFG78126.1 hypothetical protein VIPECOOM02_00242 [Escherichia phage vB_VIPECOOM02]WFG78395.1 hypothetical protein VIPECOOM03_00242 [Escherichia phage vB_VIPECOOM03]
MSDIHVTGITQVKIRCQLKTARGTAFINLSHDINSRESQLTGVITIYTGFCGREFTVGEIVGRKLKVRENALEFFNDFYGGSDKIFDEIAQAVNRGMATLVKMVNSSGYVPGPFQWEII